MRTAAQFSILSRTVPTERHGAPPGRQLTVEVATAHKVAGMFGRRDPMRRYMDKITAMADELGALPAAGVRN
jgi:hypothetical protein